MMAADIADLDGRMTYRQIRAWVDELTTFDERPIDDQMPAGVFRWICHELLPAVRRASGVGDVLETLMSGQWPEVPDGAYIWPADLDAPQA